MEIKLPKHIAYQNEDFKFELQYLGDIAYLHCEVTNWKPSVLKHMYEVFATTRLNLIDEGFRGMMTFSPNPKFAKLFGGDAVGYLEKDGNRYEVIKWELK